MFGSDNLINHPQDIRTSIINREEKLHINTKYIFKPMSLISSYQLDIHYLLRPNKYSKLEKVIFANKLIRLNHYPVQSLEFFENVKMTRGDVCNKNSDFIRNREYFDSYNKNTNYKDTLLKDLIENPLNNY
jgi:hypothetical protein